MQNIIIINVICELTHDDFHDGLVGESLAGLLTNDIDSIVGNLGLNLTKNYLSEAVGQDLLLQSLLLFKLSLLLKLSLLFKLLLLSEQLLLPDSSDGLKSKSLDI